MEERILPVAVVLIALALIFGVLTARSSNRRQKVHGGRVAGFFNYLASCTMAILPLAVLSSVFIIRLEFLQVIAVAISLMAATFISLTLYAIVERPALSKLPKSEDLGWTEKDARTSGL